MKLEHHKDMIAQLAFYKGKGTFIDKLIRWWTNSSYSHVELVVGEEWYSTSPRDLKIRVKNIQSNPSHWDFIEIEINESRLNDVFKKTSGAKYDWMGIFLSQFLPLNIHNPSKWFCSEWAAEVMGLKKSNQYSPGDLYNHTMNNKEE